MLRFHSSNSHNLPTNRIPFVRSPTNLSDFLSSHLYRFALLTHRTHVLHFPSPPHAPSKHCTHHSGPFISDSLFRHRTRTLLASLYLYHTFTNEHFLSRPQTPPAHSFACDIDTWPVIYLPDYPGDSTLYLPPSSELVPCALCRLTNLSLLDLCIDCLSRSISSRSPPPAAQLASYVPADHTLICICCPTQTYVYVSLGCSADVNFVPSSCPL